MKRKWIVHLATGLLALALLVGCGAKNSRAEAAVDMAAAEVPMPAAMGAADLAGGGTGAYSPSADPDADGAKIIYTADLELETTDFDGAAAAIRALTEDCGGYFSSSSLSNGGSCRSARYTVRVPVENYREFLDRAGGTAQLLDLYEYADDVSEEYYDTAGRLRTQQAKLDRLRELLAQAASMEDIIAIESAVSDAEEQIDRLSGQIRWYDARVDYASVDISLREVSRLSSVSDPAQGFGSRMLAALRDGLTGFAAGMEELLLALAYGWEWIALAGAVILAAILIVRRAARRRKRG